MRNAFFGSCLAALLGVGFAGPAGAAAAARPEAPVLKAQVLLARAGFSPGPIDARAGDNFVNALRAFEAANGSQPGSLDNAAWARLEALSGAPLLVSYTIQPQDVAGPFLPRIPQDFTKMATLPHLYYRSPRQLLAAKFHMSESLLEELNPGKNLAAAGTVITVVNVDGGAPNASPAAAAPANGRNAPSTAAAPANARNAPTTAVGSANGRNAPTTAVAPANGENAPTTAVAPANGENAPTTAVAPANGENAATTAAAPANGENAATTAAAPANGENAPTTAETATAQSAPRTNGPAIGSSAPPRAAASRPVEAAWIEVDKRRRAVLVHGADNRLIAFYPATIGSAEKPAPSGTFRVRSIVRNPTYTYDPRYHFKGQHARSKVKVAPGPNNPVGLVWIGLSDPGYGIHGAPDPDAVGKTHSHGCIRLTNWDALALARQVRKGTPVLFTG